MILGTYKGTDVFEGLELTLERTEGAGTTRLLATGPHASELALHVYQALAAATNGRHIRGARLSHTIADEHTVSVHGRLRQSRKAFERALGTYSLHVAADLCRVEMKTSLSASVSVPAIRLTPPT